MNESHENRKALPKFFLSILSAGLLGGVIGLFVGLSNIFGLDAGALSAKAEVLLRAVLPWGTPVFTAVLSGGALWFYRAAGKKISAWDGGDESGASMDAENLLSWMMLLSAVQLLAALFFFAAAIHYSVKSGLTGTLYHVAWLFLSCGLAVFEQQKAVDLTKRMNPEKRGSVYDMQFQKKWLECCDESERQQIGQAAYHTYQTTSRVCLWMWVALVVLDMIFGFGVLPSFIVLLVLGVMQTVYVLECIRLSRKSAL